MLSTLAELRALVRRRGVAAVTGEGSLVDAIAGERVKGGWWGHARGKVIFGLLSQLEDHEGVLCVKLEGRVTFVDRALWPALARVVMDDERRANATKTLPRDARALLREVERAGEVRLDSATSMEGKNTKEVRAVRESLQESLLVHVDQVHSEKGKHVTRMRVWERVLPADAFHAARANDLREATVALALRPSVLTPRR